MASIKIHDQPSEEEICNPRDECLELFVIIAKESHQEIKKR